MGTLHGGFAEAHLGFHFPSIPVMLLMGGIKRNRWAATIVMINIVCLYMRTGSTYAAYVSGDGGVWDFVGSHTAGFRPTRVGLIADQADATLERMAYFDYFALDDRTPQMYLPLVIR